MSVRWVRASRKSDFLVGALERNVEPGKERVDIWTKVKVRINAGRSRATEIYNHRECKSGKKVQQMKDPPSLQSEGQYAAKKFWESDGMI